MRIGYGWDSHEFQTGVTLKIGGVTLPHTHGLAGHSDGDVLLHAITDALLGAVAAGDIGSYFPPSDPKWKGADSVIFLEEALKQVRLAGYTGFQCRFNFDHDGTQDCSACKKNSGSRGRTSERAAKSGWDQSKNTRRHGHRQRGHRACCGVAGAKEKTTSK